eukprot:15483853-Alexandrium_andersonii.AAC.1
MVTLTAARCCLLLRSSPPSRRCCRCRSAQPPRAPLPAPSRASWRAGRTRASTPSTGALRRGPPAGGRVGGPPAHLGQPR